MNDDLADVGGINMIPRFLRKNVRNAFAVMDAPFYLSSKGIHIEGLTYTIQFLESQH